MRTCPNCGKDTSAETTQPCTKCGFSPAAAAEIGTTNYGGDTLSVGEVSTGETTDYGLPDALPQPPATEKKRSGIGKVVLLLIILGAFGFDLIGGLFDGDVGDIFESDRGPTDIEVEKALVDYAEQQVGLPGAAVVCPEDSVKTEVDASFDCTVTMPSGATRSVTVTNREDEFEWNGRPFFHLQREGAIQ